MGTATAPVALSASWPAWIWSVSKRWDMLLPLFAFRRDDAVVWLAHGRFSPAPFGLPGWAGSRFRIGFAAESGAARWALRWRQPAQSIRSVVCSVCCVVVAGNSIM